MLKKIAEFLDLVDRDDEEAKKTAGKKVTIDEKEDKTVITIGSGPFRRVIRLHSSKDVPGESNSELMEVTVSDVSVRARICGNLLAMMGPALSAKGLSFVTGLPIIHGEKPYTPDICIIGSENIPKVVIEISEIDELYEDMVDKLNVYEKAGVKEYWVIIIGVKCVISYCFEQKAVNIFTNGQPAAMETIGTQSLSVDKIFDGI